MKRNLIILTALIMVSVSMASAGQETSYGKGLTLDSAIPIEDVLAKPNDYVGKRIRVDGIITGVCKNRGCWMQVSDENGRGLRIKVEDGVIVFPATSMGHRASAEGVFEAIPVKAEQAAHDEKDHSGCAKSKAAEASAKGGCAKSKAAAAEGGSGCAKSKEAANEKEAGCDAKAQGQYVYLVRGTGAVTYS